MHLYYPHYLRPCRYFTAVRSAIEQTVCQSIREQTRSRRASGRYRCHDGHIACSTGMSCNNVYTRLQSRLQLTLQFTIPLLNIMAPSSLNQGNAPKTLTLFPFHNHPRSRQTQPSRPPRSAQQPTPPIPHPYIRNPHNLTLAPTISTANRTSIVRNVRPAVVLSRPNPATTRDTPRARNVAVKSNTSTALSPRVRASTQTTRTPITTVTKVHAIAPVAGITSIDSVLCEDSKHTKEKTTVPDHIRPKAEAIK